MLRTKRPENNCAQRCKTMELSAAENFCRAPAETIETCIFSGCVQAVALRERMHVQGTHSRVGNVHLRVSSLQLSNARWPAWCVSPPSSTCWMPLAKKHPCTVSGSSTICREWQYPRLWTYCAEPDFQINMTDTRG